MYFSTHEVSNTRFLVAKYIRDMHRLEPRNIGVVVWIDGILSARFLGEDTSSPGTVRAPRSLKVHDQEAYSEWIRHWREQMSLPALSINANGEQVSRESPKFVDALKNKSKLHFILVDAGFLRGKTDPKDIGDVVSDLFESLVADKKAEASDATEEESHILTATIAHAIKDSGIAKIKGYSTKLPLTFPVDSHSLAFTFDSGIYTDRPIALFQHANLTRPSSVNSAAFMFDCIRKSDYEKYRLPKKRCIAFVRATRQLVDSSPNAAAELAKLRIYGEVADLAQYDEGVDVLRRMATTLAV